MDQIITKQVPELGEYLPRTIGAQRPCLDRTVLAWTADYGVVRRIALCTFVLIDHRAPVCITMLRTIPAIDLWHIDAMDGATPFIQPDCTVSG
jgi:hypothetical protein